MFFRHRSPKFFSSFKKRCSTLFSCCSGFVTVSSLIGVAKISIISTVVTVLIGYSPIGQAIMARYIKERPRDIIDSLQEMDRKERERSDLDAKEGAVKVFDSVTKDSSVPFLGEANAQHSIVLFYDYACGYCTKMAVELKEVMKRRKDVKILLCDFPILHMTSLMSAKASLFVWKNYPQKMGAFFFDLLEKPSKDEASIKAVAKSIGIPLKDIEKAIVSSDYDSHLKESYAMASQIKLNGTPAVIVNGKLFVGLVSADQIIEALDGSSKK